MPDTEGVEPKTMTVGANNVFEVGCGILCKLWYLHTHLHSAFTWYWNIAELR